MVLDSIPAFALFAIGLALIIGSPIAWMGDLLPAWQAAVGIAAGLWALWQVIE